MESCANKAYIPRNIQLAFEGVEIEEIKEENDWEVHSDSLNESLDSGSDEEIYAPMAVHRGLEPEPEVKLLASKALGSMRKSSKKQGGTKRLVHGGAKKHSLEVTAQRVAPAVVKKPAAPSKLKKKKVAKERVNRQGRVFKAEVDSNVMSIELKVLKEDGTIASGDPVFCEKCGVVLNKHSTIHTIPGEDEKSWKCEF